MIPMKQDFDSFYLKFPKWSILITNLLYYTAMRGTLYIFPLFEIIYYNTIWLETIHMYAGVFIQLIDLNKTKKKNHTGIVILSCLENFNNKY